LKLVKQDLVVPVIESGDDQEKNSTTGLKCENDICMIQAPISPDFFEEGNVSTVSFRGVAVVDEEEFAFDGDFSVFMESSAAKGAVITDSSNANGVDDTDQGSRRKRAVTAAWLVPLMALVGISALAVYFTQSRSGS
jgi:hypothetical protein